MNPHRKYEKKPKADALYTKVEEELGVPDKSKAEQCKEWIEKHVFELEQWDVDLSKKNILRFSLMHQWKTISGNANDIKFLIFIIVIRILEKQMALHMEFQTITWG